MAPAAATAGDPADPGRTQTLAYGSGQLAFPYVVYTPTTYHRGRPAPLLVVVHGCQTTAEQQMRASLSNRLAERERFVVLYPDVDAAGASQPGPLRSCWRIFSETSWHRGGDDAAAIAGMARTVMRRWRIDPERVYLVGISAGGFMTSIMAAAYPDLYAAVGIMPGARTRTPRASSATPTPGRSRSAPSAPTRRWDRARVSSPASSWAGTPTPRSPRRAPTRHSSRGCAPTTS